MKGVDFLKNLKHSKIGITSFIFALIIIISFIIITVRDILFPISFTGPEKIHTVPIVSPGTVILIMTAISFISFVLGLVARFEKESKKTLPTIAIVISGVFLIPAIIGLIKGIFLRLSM